MKKIGIFTIAAIALILAYAGNRDSVRSSSAKSAAPTCAKSKAQLLIDQTVGNKDDLMQNIDSAYNQIRLDIVQNTGQFLGGEVALSTINSNGENPDEWRISIPQTLGYRKINLSQGLFKIKEKVDQFKKKVSSIDETRYQKTLIVEAIEKSLKSLGKCDTLYVVSDFYLVDGKNNFEKNIFSNPPDLTGLNQPRVQIMRVVKDGATQDQISKIENWWKKALFGSPDWVHKASRTKFVKRKDYKRRLDDRIRRSVENITFEANSAILSAQNNRFSRCAKEFIRGGGQLPKRITLIVTVADGTPIRVDTIEREHSELSSCFANVVTANKFLEHPRKKVYKFEKKFEFSRG